jgi:hypothetical protein
MNPFKVKVTIENGATKETEETTGTCFQVQRRGKGDSSTEDKTELFLFVKDYGFIWHPASQCEYIAPAPKKS